MNDEETLDYLNKLHKRVKERQIDQFWMLVDRPDFKPIKNLTNREIREKIENNLKYYAGKRIAIVKINVINDELRVKKNDSLIHLVFDIWKIDSTGYLRSSSESLKVRYYKDDLEKRKLKLKDVHRFMQLCANNILGTSVIGGLKFSVLMKKLEDKKIVF
jgi:hypothetical protein